MAEGNKYRNYDLRRLNKLNEREVIYSNDLKAVRVSSPNVFAFISIFLPSAICHLPSAICHHFDFSSC